MYTSRRDWIRYWLEEMEEEEDSHSRLLLIKIKESFDNPAYSDIKVKSETRLFNAHKIILNTRNGGWGVRT